MIRNGRATETAATIGALVALAIGLRLVLSGASVAASTCTDPLERAVVRRLTGSMVQVLREISERAAVVARTPAAGPDWSEASNDLRAPVVPVAPRRLFWSVWVFSRPPPAAAC